MGSLSKEELRPNEKGGLEPGLMFAVTRGLAGEAQLSSLFAGPSTTTRSREYRGIFSVTSFRAASSAAWSADEPCVTS